MFGACSGLHLGVVSCASLHPNNTGGGFSLWCTLSGGLPFPTVLDRAAFKRPLQFSSGAAVGAVGAGAAAGAV